MSPGAVRWKQELKVRAAGGADRDAMKSAWEAAGRARTGMLVRTDGVWRARLADERSTWLVVEGDGGIEGHVSWTVEQAEPEGPTTLVVHEIGARSDRATRSLWAAIAAQRDQVTEVHADVADDDPIDRAFVDADRDRVGSLRVPHPIGELTLGPMVRIADIERALLTRGWSGSGRLALDAGEGTVVLDVRDGVATISPSRAEPALTLDRVTLAALAFGGLRASQAARFGWLAAREEATLLLADAVLGLPSYFSPERF
jgi:predicted acetyltransferase